MIGPCPKYPISPNSSPWSAVTMMWVFFGNHVVELLEDPVEVAHRVDLALAQLVELVLIEELERLS